MQQIITKHWFRHLLVLVALIILINLGLWQLRRLEQRQALNKAILAGLNEPPVTLTGQTVEPEELHLRRVSVTGEFDNEAGIILRSRNFRGRQGAEMVVPLHIAGSRQTALVNRGWIPLASADRRARRAYDAEGEVTIEGIAYRTQTRPNSYLAPTDPTPKPGEGRLDAWFRVDIERIQTQVDYPLLPIFIEQAPNPESTIPPLREEKIELSDGPHLGYALQWFSFAIILLAIYLAFTRQEWQKEMSNA